MPSLPSDTLSSLHIYVRSLPKHFDDLSESLLTLNRSSSVIAVLIRIIDLPCYHKVFVQKERTWIISSSLIRIGIIAYDSSLLGVRFTGFGLSFWISWWMLNVKEQPLLHQSCRFKYPRTQSKWLVRIYGHFILSPRWRGSNAFLPICSKMPYSDGWKLVCQQHLRRLKLTPAQRLLTSRLISVLAK